MGYDPIAREAEQLRGAGDCQRKETRMGAIIARVNEYTLVIQDISRRLDRASDRLYGALPQGEKATQEAVSPRGEMAELDYAIECLSESLRFLDEAASRLTDGL